LGKSENRLYICVHLRNVGWNIPEFIKEMLDSENDEVIGPFKNADELKAYIKSLPDEDE
jgi:hypothetical protein